MTIQEIIDRARRLCYVSSSQYSNTLALEDMNIIYNDLTQSITQELDEDFFFDDLYTDLKVREDEYVLTDSVNNIYINKVKSVFVKYEPNEVDYTEALQVSKDDFFVRKSNASKNNPIFYIADNSIFLYPEGEQVVEKWLKVDVIVKPIEITLATDERDILIASEFRYIIIEWMKEYIYQSRGLLNEANQSRQIYLQKKNEMINLLTDRWPTPSVWTLPDLTFYE